MAVSGGYQRTAFLADEVQPAGGLAAGRLPSELLIRRWLVHPDIQPTTKRHEAVR
jgi:hypothetical protein